MPRKLFTPEEANAMLAQVRPVVERVTEASAALREAQAQLAVLLRTHGEATMDTPGHPAREHYWSLVARAREMEDRLQQLADELAFQGVELKDLDRGLLDFRSQRDGEEVCLCWQLGEPEVAWWHGLKTGFAGRQPILKVERRPPSN